jgi:hypothetical protein
MRRLSFLESLRAIPLRTDKAQALSRSELSRQIAVDFEADADFNEGRGRPSHDFLLDFPCLAACARCGRRKLSPIATAL